MRVFYAETHYGELTGRTSRHRNRFPNFVSYGVSERDLFDSDLALDQEARRKRLHPEDSDGNDSE